MGAESVLLESIRSSPSMVISQQARHMRRAGEDVVTLSMGEPDLETPDRIKQAAARAIIDGHTKYTDVDGIADLKKAIQIKFARDNTLAYGLDQINVSPGGKAVLYNALRASLNPGDEVIIPAPYWVSYPDMVHLCDGIPVIVPAHVEDGFILQPQALAAAITDRTRWLIVNSPGNPAGTVYSADQFRALAEVLDHHRHVRVFADDIYEHLVYDGAEFSSIAAACPDLHSRTVTMNGVSKAYAMTGWRIGFAGGPKDLIAAMAKVMTQTTSCPCSISQWATVEALRGDQSFLAERLDVFGRRRDLAMDILSRARGLVCLPPQGAFYIFLLAHKLIGKITAGGHTLASDQDIASALLTEDKVALVPGSAFGFGPALRLSFAAADDTLERGCERIVSFCQKLTPPDT